MAATLTIGKRKKAAADQDQFAECEWRESERRTALDVIYNLLQLSLHRLWDPPLADDAFVEYESFKFIFLLLFIMFNPFFIIFFSIVW